MSDLCRTRALRLALAGAIAAGIAASGRVIAADPNAAAAEDPAPSRRRPPPLVVDEDQPLLLLEKSPADGAAPPTPASGPIANNRACFVCHTNYEKEALARLHAAEKIGCAECHGDSFAHRNDENNTTPPDTMFPRGAIDDMCRKCHESHDAGAQDVIDRFQKRCTETTDPKTVVCTDCHGRHRLAVRTVLWNKKTGRLIADDER